MKLQLQKFSTYQKLAMLTAVFVVAISSAALANRVLAQGSEPVATSEGHVISIYDRGEERVIVTKSRTLRQALEAAKIDVAVGHDVVEPALDTELVANKYNVNIYRARPVTVIDGAVRQKVTTAEQTPEAIAKAAGITLHKEDNVNMSATQDLVVDGASVVMSIDRATTVTFTMYGKVTQSYTRAKTVDNFLKEKNIILSESDRLSVDKSAAISEGMSFELWREGKQTVTVEEDVDFPVEKVQDANRDPSFKEVTTPGSKGKKNVTYEIEIKNGQEVARKEIASVTTEEPKKQVETIGSKLPTPTNPTESQTIGREMMLAAGYGESEWPCLYNLWMRESGWRTTAGNTSSGAYGIPQSLPASKMAAFGSDYLTNPRTQIAWGLSYIKGRYSTPCGAWSSFQAKGWY